MRTTLSGLLCVGALGVAMLHAAPGATPVADAAMARDAAAVRALLKQAADVNGAQADGMTALHWAASNGDAELAQMLVHAGANPKATTRINGYTPLFLASESGHADVIDVLIKGGADAKAVSRSGSTPLMLAAAAGATAAVGRLLDAGADVNARETARGQTALLFAAAANRVPVIRLLAERGADLSAATKILDLYAVAREEEAKRPQRGGGGGGRQSAPRKPQVPGLERAYNYLELIGNQGGVTALHYAARQGYLEAAQVLLDAGARVNQPSGDGTSPLLIATINGHFDLANLLLDRGADPAMAAENGVAPLYAVLNCEWAPKANYPQPRAHQQQKTTYLELMAALLEHGADPNARLSKKVWYSGYNSDLSGVEESGATPFWRAAYASDIPAMRLLLKYGADPNIPAMKTAGRVLGNDSPGRDAKDVSGLPPLPVGGPSVTPLQAATGVGYAEGFAANSHRIHPAGWMPAVTFLVEELGADVNAKDHDGNTALHHAAARGDVEMILYLVSKGADVKAVNREGQTTADMANGPVQRTQPYPEALALLEKLGSKNNHKCVSC
jgi:ankyrin repeat protein